MMEISISGGVVLAMISALLAALAALIGVVYHNLREQIKGIEQHFEKQLFDLRQYTRHEVRTLNGHHTKLAELIIFGKDRRTGNGRRRGDTISSSVDDDDAL